MGRPGCTARERSAALLVAVCAVACTPATPEPRVPPPAALVPRARSAPSAEPFFLWQGLDHEWLRSFFGARVPHRVSLLGSEVTSEDTAPRSSGAARGVATFAFAQNTGVDGNFMRPVGYISGVLGASVLASRAVTEFAGTDDATEVSHPQGHVDEVKTISFDFPNAPAGAVSAFVLQGFEFESSCDPDKQPPNRPCNSHGLWPYDLRVSLGECSRVEQTFSCPITFRIYRAWTPNKGGLPPFEVKPLNDKLDWKLRLRSILIVGNSSTFEAVAITSKSDRKLNDPTREPQLHTIHPSGPGPYLTATVGITGFGFELHKIGDADRLLNLGRYIGGLRFNVDGEVFDRTLRTLTFRANHQVWAPGTVVESGVRSFLEARALFFGSGATVHQAKAGSLCVNSSKQAPFFSRWRACGGKKRGPERSRDAVTFEIP